MKQPVAGAPAAPSNVFAHFAAQSHAQPRSSPVQLQPYPRPNQLERPSQLQAPQHVYGQPRTALESIAARTRSHDAHFSDQAHQEQCQPQQSMGHLAPSRGPHHAPSVPAQVPRDEQRTASPYGQPQTQDVFAGLAAHSRGYQEAPMSAAAHEEEWRSSPPQAQQPPRNTFESIAERSRHLDERRQAGSATPVQPASGQTALAGEHMPGSSGPVHGIVRGHDFPQHQQSDWAHQQVPTHAPHGADDAGEASFSFAPAGVPLPPQNAAPAHMSLRNMAHPAHRAPAQHPQSQRGRPVPAAYQPAARTWQAHAHQHAAPAEPVLQQPAGTVRQPNEYMGQISSPHAHAASLRAEPAPQAPDRVAAEVQPQEQAQALAQGGFYFSWVQNLSSSMEANAPAWRHPPASRPPFTAQAPSVPQGVHQPGQGRTTQRGGNAASVQSMPAEAHPAMSRAPASAHAALPAHHSGQAQAPQQGSLP